MAQTLFLIDGNSLLNRAYYALPPLTTAEGIPTNAIYGFSTMLARLLADYQPNQILVAFDVSAPTFRHEAYTEYKATRKGMPDDLRPQVGMLKDVLDAWGIARLELAGYEADDIIGTAAKKGEAAGFQVYIVTADRDALQLISEQTTVLLTKRGIKEIETVDRAGLLRDYNLEPYQVIELKGLMGDSSDNIPGIPGVGEKTAMKLLEKYQSIAGVYENLDQEKGKLRERLEEHRDLALLSKELATIDCEVPLEIDLQFKPERNDEELLAVFQKLEFRTLVDRLRQDGGVVTESPADPITYLEFNQENSGDFDSNLAKATSCGIYFDSENFAIATDKENWYIPASDHELVLAKLQEKSKEVELFCNDSKAIFQAYADQNGDLNQFNIAGDISLAAYILDPVAPNDLTSLSLRYSDLEALPEYDDPIQAAVASAERIYQLGSILDKRIASEDMTHLYHDVELPLAKVLTRMEFRGIRCNTELLRKIATEIEVTLTKLRETIYDISGEEFNINSPKQLGVILFDKLGLPVIKKTKTGPSTDAEVLDQLSFHPIVANLLEYRQLNKLKSTYTDALIKLVNPKTGRLHTTFNQTITATGRLSSANPNLQNIPIRTREGRRIRGAFEPAEGWHLVVADYSQIELRILAHISNDAVMVEAFKTGADIHRRTAAEVFQIPMDSVTPEQRDSAKAINFGIVYGISSFGLAKGTNLTRAEAQHYIDQYFSRYPGVKSYLDNIIVTAKEQGYVTTLLNRRRYLPNIKSRNYQQRSFAERMAMNTPIQGSAADIIKIAMLKVDQKLREEKMAARLLLQVHDELVLEVPTDEVNEVAKLVKECMESVMELAVPLRVDLKVGPNWEQVNAMDEVE